MQYDLNLNNLKPFSDLNISIPFLKKLNDLILQENTRHISALVLFHTHILLNLTLRGNSLKQNIPELANLIKRKLNYLMLNYHNYPKLFLQYLLPNLLQ